MVEKLNYFRIDRKCAATLKKFKKYRKNFRKILKKSGETQKHIISYL